jgi:hypothetical protein
MTEKNYYKMTLEKSGGALLEHSIPSNRGRNMWCAPKGWTKDQQKSIDLDTRMGSCNYLMDKINKKDNPLTIGWSPRAVPKFRCSDSNGHNTDCVYQNDPALYNFPADAQTEKISDFCDAAEKLKNKRQATADEKAAEVAQQRTEYEAAKNLKKT